VSSDDSEVKFLETPSRSTGMSLLHPTTPPLPPVNPPPPIASSSSLPAANVNDDYQLENSQTHSSYTPMTSAQTLPCPRTPPPPTASSSKRMLTPEGSPCDDAKKKPKLKKITSAIRNAFQVAKEAKDICDKSKFGLLNFFSRGTARIKGRTLKEKTRGQQILNQSLTTM
jgi:hypothetical protein